MVATLYATMSRSGVKVKIVKKLFERILQFFLLLFQKRFGWWFTFLCPNAPPDHLNILIVIVIVFPTIGLLHFLQSPFSQLSIQPKCTFWCFWGHLSELETQPFCVSSDILFLLPMHHLSRCYLLSTKHDNLLLKQIDFRHSRSDVCYWLTGR